LLELHYDSEHALALLGHPLLGV